MKNTIILFGVLAMLLVFASCEDDTTGNLSSITYFPDFTLIGEANQIIGCEDESYVEEGATAIENGVDLTVSTSIVGTYFGEATVGGPDFYSIVYSAENSDGFEGSAFRSVDVLPCKGDLIENLSGVYTADVKRGGVADPQYEGMGPVMIREASSGDFEVTDVLGGYYDLGRGYGPNYSGKGAGFTGSGGSFTGTGIGFISGFGIQAEIDGAVLVDPVAKTITYVAQGNFGNSTFDVVLTQQ